MSRERDNWERLVAAVLRKQQLWKLFHAQSRSPSICSEASESSSSINFGSPLHDVLFDCLSVGEELEVHSSFDAKKKDDGGSSHVSAQVFTFRELAAATKNFRADCLLREGGFGRLYKGRLESTNQIVSIKQIDRDGLQGNREFLVEVLMLSLLHHPHMVNLIGHCADGDQRLIVYEYVPLGSLGDHLHGYHPKLSDFGLAKLGPVGDKTHVSTRVMGTYGYCAPEYAMTGQLTVKADVYSFGVVLLEIITGRKAIDNSRAAGEHNLVAWACPLLKDRRKFLKMPDPLMQGQYPIRALYQALAVAAMCLQEQPNMRPSMSQVATAISYLALQEHDHKDKLSKGPAWTDPSIPIM